MLTLVGLQIAGAMTGAVVIENPRTETERWLLDTVARLSRDAGIDSPDVALYASPVRPDPRPLQGVLLAVFV